VLRRERANARTKRGLDPASTPDPLLRGEAERRRRTGPLGLGVPASITLHAAVVAFVLLSARPGSSSTPAYEQAVEFRLIEPPKVEPQEEPTPVVPPPELPPERAVAKPVPKSVPVSERPPPDPIDLPPKMAREAAPETTPRRIVGINFESTTTGGEGEAFAVGNTRMGHTALVADDPNKADKLDHVYQPPRRTSVYVPEYPASLRGQGLRDDVGLEVAIDATGHVTRVTRVRPSAREEFNRLAEDAAVRSAYQPATLDGAAVARSITITVHFEPKE